MKKKSKKIRMQERWACVVDGQSIEFRSLVLKYNYILGHAATLTGTLNDTYKLTMPNEPEKEDRYLCIEFEDGDEA